MLIINNLSFSSKKLQVGLHVFTILGLILGYWLSGKSTSCESRRMDKVLSTHLVASQSSMQYSLLWSQQFIGGGPKGPAAAKYREVLALASKDAREYQGAYLNVMKEDACSRWDNSVLWVFMSIAIIQVCAAILSVVIEKK